MDALLVLFCLVVLVWVLGLIAEFCVLVWCLLDCFAFDLYAYCFDSLVCFVVLTALGLCFAVDWFWLICLISYLLFVILCLMIGLL